jgi:hypothetical protein
MKSKYTIEIFFEKYYPSLLLIGISFLFFIVGVLRQSYELLAIGALFFLFGSIGLIFEKVNELIRFTFDNPGAGGSN